MADPSDGNMFHGKILRQINFMNSPFELTETDSGRTMILTLKFDLTETCPLLLLDI